MDDKTKNKLRLKEVQDKIKEAQSKGKSVPLGLKQEEKFYLDGHVKPYCINAGCENDVRWREKKYWSMKSECSRCENARKKGIDIPGVQAAKKTYCENRDNILSFPCPIKPEAWEGENYFKDSLDLDHIDGNHDNNIPENIRTLCKLCHTFNSRLEKQWDSNKESGRDIEG